MTRDLPHWAMSLQRLTAGGAAACRTKVRYESDVHARASGRNVMRVSTRPDTPPRLFVYPCPNCRGWHLTRKPNTAAAVTALTSHEGVVF
jgi:hypothetical protein